MQVVLQWLACGVLVVLSVLASAVSGMMAVEKDSDSQWFLLAAVLLVAIGVGIRP